MRAILFISLIFTINILVAQNQPIINGVETFGIWDSTAAGELPQYWDGFNREVIVNGNSYGDVVCVTKSSDDPQDSDYSVSLVSTSILGGAAVPGMLTTGNLNIDFMSQNGDITGGIPYSLQPTKLKGWYKYYPQNNDSASISVWFNNNGQSIGGGSLKIDGTHGVWTLFEVDLLYQNGISPDTMNILFSTSTAANAVPLGSKLEIDHIWFEGGNVAINNSQEALNSTKIYPNPASESLNIDTPKSIGSYNINIYNSIGERVLSSNRNSEMATINITSLGIGAYFVEVIADGKRNIRKIIIAR